MPCAFCGEPFQKPHRARSEEHAFAKWLAEYLPNPNDEFSHAVHSPQGEVLHSWTSRELDVVASRVCEPCNTGWMAASENRARPYLSALVQGRDCTLYRKGQTVLATWAAKTALALQLAIPGNIAIPQLHYRQIAKRQTRPPDNTQIWLAAYEGIHQLFSDPKHLTLAPTEGGPPVDGYQMTFVINHAVFQVFGHFYKEPVTRERPALADVAPQIWPVLGTVEFPPPVVLSDYTLGRFCVVPFSGEVID
jgi:hypothetical protein